MTFTTLPRVEDTVVTHKHVDWSEFQERCIGGLNNVGLVLAVIGRQLHKFGIYLSQL
jgi:hypothetical protein